MLERESVLFDRGEHLFRLDPSITYFNASYGVVPIAVQDAHHALLRECEANPYKWSTDRYLGMVADVRRRLAKMLMCASYDLVMVDNSSSAANSIFASIDFGVTEKPAVVVLETAYGLIMNLATKYARLYDAKVVHVPVNPDKLGDVPGDMGYILDTLRHDGYRVCLACVDHISSCPALLMPVEAIAQECKKRHVDVLVDGAHVLGQLSVDISRMAQAGVTYWFADVHKWFFSPKGSAVMWVRHDKQPSVNPVIDCTSSTPNRYIMMKRDRGEEDVHPCTSFERRFSYLGTKDYTPWIAVGAAIDFVEAHGGYDSIVDRNQKIARFAYTSLTDAISSECCDGVHDYKKENVNIETSMCNIHLPFVKNETDATRLVMHLENRKIYTVVFRYRRSFWMRLCVQLFINVVHVVRLKETLVEYIRQHTSKVLS